MATDLQRFVHKAFPAGHGVLSLSQCVKDVTSAFFKSPEGVVNANYILALNRFRF